MQNTATAAPITNGEHGLAAAAPHEGDDPAAEHYNVHEGQQQQQSQQQQQQPPPPQSQQQQQQQGGGAPNAAQMHTNMNGNMPPQQVYVDNMHGGNPQGSTTTNNSNVAALESQFQALGMPSGEGMVNGGSVDVTKPTAEGVDPEEEIDGTDGEDDPLKLFVGQVCAKHTENGVSLVMSSQNKTCSFFLHFTLLTHNNKCCLASFSITTSL